ncbi:MAG: KH domain-containing protein [Lachnospiraceae bacterium]|nr:KH domain-containing protein [Lachnospiraceae bacterium]
MKKIEVSAKTVEEAVTQAMIELGTTSDRMEYRVINEGRSGFVFGIGSKPALIQAWVKEDAMGDVDSLLNSIEKTVAQEFNGVSAKKVKDEPRPVQKQKAQNQPQKAADRPADKKQDKAQVKNEKAPKADKTADRPVKAAAPAKEAAPAKSAAKAEPAAPVRAEAPAKEAAPAKPAAKAEPAAPAKAEAPAKEAAPAEPQQTASEAPAQVKAEEPANAASVPERPSEALDITPQEFVTQVCNAMGLEVTLESKFNETERILDINMLGDDMGILIGKRGQTLDSLQYLAGLVANKNEEDYIRVKLDTENYRERRKQTLENLAKNISSKVKRTRKPVSLEPMNPYERRIIHATLQNDKFVFTKSEGEEPFRHVVIAMKKEKMGSGSHGGKGGYNRFNKNGRRGPKKNFGGRYRDNKYAQRNGNENSQSAPAQTEE